ncbi:MAG TPA: bile acid:sodium symporter, partial [Marinobacter hydrocarbonoclasticus]|nr:bile acid:sodium symporter [Marinobacter nauticus]
GVLMFPIGFLLAMYGRKVIPKSNVTHAGGES